LWFEIFQLKTNMTSAQVDAFHQGEIQGIHYIIAMHPHGVVPFQGILWAAFCNLYLRDSTGYTMYGFGAVADVVLMLPVLRTLMGFLACSGAGYSALYMGLVEGICSAANAAGRRPKHLFILPGGIAEVFVSTPGEHKIIFRKRYGLVKLAIETGSSLIPCYVFGGTDFFHNLITADNLLAKWSRKLRVTFTVFFGRFGLPIPFSPVVTMVFADPLPVVKWNSQDGPIPKKLIEELHERYETAIKEVFDKYKVVAGYPNCELEIV
jgi:2-acylglycerol O-acyltransferase 2